MDYRRLWDGVDLRYNGEDGILKGTYTVGVGSDPNDILWRYDGAAGVEIDSLTGDLQIVLASGESLVEKAPVAWQDIAGERQAVEVAFRLQETGAIGFCHQARCRGRFGLQHLFRGL